MHSSVTYFPYLSSSINHLLHCLWHRLIKNKKPYPQGITITVEIRAFNPTTPLPETRLVRDRSAISWAQCAMKFEKAFLSSIYPSVITLRTIDLPLYRISDQREIIRHLNDQILAAGPISNPEPALIDESSHPPIGFSKWFRGRSEDPPIFRWQDMPSEPI